MVPIIAGLFKRVMPQKINSLLSIPEFNLSICFLASAGNLV
jgi:hypothetical protein